MKFKEYLELLNKLAKENPKAMEFDVITSIDDEGNGYNPVVFGPCLVKFQQDGVGGEIFDEDEVDVKELNSVILN